MEQGDGENNCKDGSDECINNAFSNKLEMIRNAGLRYFVWITAMIALLANLIVAYKHLIKLHNLSRKHSSAYYNTLLLTNLAFSDMLMGVSLLVVAVKSLEFSGVYCQKNHEWRTSSSCNFVGAMTIISSQTSMNCLVLLTGVRLLTINNPLITIRLRYLHGCIVSVWVLSLLYSLLPVLTGEHFVTAFHTKVNRLYVKCYVERDVVDRNQKRLQYLFEKFKTDYNSSEVSKEDWLQQFPDLSLNIKGYFGYYSSNSVCFPDFFSANYPAMPLSITILLNNFFGIVFIACSYVCIIHKTSKPVAGRHSTVNKSNDNMKRRVTCIIVTNALCWTPIIIAAFVSYLGHKLPALFHPFSAIVILPINSVINPIIYSKVDGFVKKNIQNLIKRISSCSKRNDVKAVVVELDNL